MPADDGTLLHCAGCRTLDEDADVIDDNVDAGNKELDKVRVERNPGWRTCIRSHPNSNALNHAVAIIFVPARRTGWRAVCLCSHLDRSTLTHGRLVGTLSQQAVNRHSTSFRNMIVALLFGASGCLLFLDYYA